MLTARELQVAYLVADGNSNAETAYLLHIAVSTVKNHLQNIFDKLGLDNRQMLTERIQQLRKVA